MEVVTPSMRVSRLDLVVLDSVAAGSIFPRLPWSFRNIVVFIEQRGGSGAPEVGSTHLGALGPPITPWWVLHPSSSPSVASLAHWLSSGPKKSSRSCVAFGLRLILISCGVKNMLKTATDTGHYVYRLVPKIDIK